MDPFTNQRGKEKWEQQHSSMPNIVALEEEEEPRFRSCSFLSPSLSCSATTPRRRSFSYHRLPVHLLKLTVLKLDNSSFDVHVARTALVRELKAAVEEVFGRAQKENISWAHVWGHFCLCYRGLKLIEDKAMLKSFGVKDGDQLQFVRHLSISYTPIQQLQRGHPTNAERRRNSWSGAKLLDFEFKEPGRDNRRDRDLPPAVDDDTTNQSANEWGLTNGGEDEHRIIKHCSMFKLSRYLKGWLCYSYANYTRRARSGRG